MTTPDYTKKMSELRAQVRQYSKLPNDSKSGFARVTSSIPKINTQSPLFYAAPPIIIIVILYFMKPSFVCTDNIDIDNNITKKLSYKKLLIAALISGVIISVGLFAYFKKK